MADQNVPRYQQINVSDFVNFFLKGGLFIMEGERCALCNWWSDVVTAVLKVIYKGCFKFFVALYSDRICSDQHFVENCIEKFPSV